MKESDTVTANKPTKSDWLFLLLLLTLGFLLRFGEFDSFGTSFYFVDVSRDYLVSSHIINYQEYPLSGPDSHLGANLASPLYYYVNSLLLLINDNVFWPGVVNVFLQSLAIIFVWLTARNFTNRRVAYTAAIFFTFLDASVFTSVFMWQPHLMQVFLLLSLWSLSEFFIVDRHSQKYFFLSILTFALAIHIHQSALVLVPAYFLSSYIIHKYKKLDFKQYYKGVIFFVIVFALCVMPSLYFHLTNTEELNVPLGYEEMNLPANQPDQTVGQIIDNFFQRSSLFVTYYFQGQEYFSDINKLTNLHILILIFLSIAYFGLEIDHKRRFLMICLLLSIFSLLVAVAFLKLDPKAGFPLRYFIPIMAPTFILLAELIVSFAKKTKFPLAVTLLAIFFVIGLGSNKLSLNYQSAMMKMNGSLMQTHPSYLWSDDIDWLANYIKEEELKLGKDFWFNLVTIRWGKENPYMDSLTWLPLEIVMDKPLVKVDDNAFRGVTALDDKVLILRCVETEVVDCRDIFHSIYPNSYSQGAILYESGSVNYLQLQKIN